MGAQGATGESGAPGAPGAPGSKVGVQHLLVQYFCADEGPMEISLILCTVEFPQ